MLAHSRILQLEDKWLVVHNHIIVEKASHDRKQKTTNDFCSAMDAEEELLRRIVAKLGKTAIQGGVIQRDPTKENNCQTTSNFISSGPRMSIGSWCNNQGKSMLWSGEGS
jgi:hypothetical protein